MTGLTKEDILQVKDIKPIEVECPEWKGSVWLLPLDGERRDRWDQIGSKKLAPSEGDPDWRGLRAELIALHLCDQEGKLLGFTEAEVLRLGHKSAKVLNRLFMVCQDVSGISDDTFEEMAKNSNADQNGEPG